MGLPQLVTVEKTVHRVEIHCQVKKKWSVKKVILRLLWVIKELIIIDFLEEGTTINSADYCQILRQHSLYLLNDPRVSV